MSKGKTCYLSNPFQRQGAVVGLISNHILFCGGADNFDYTTDKCYELGNVKAFTTMKTARSWAASIAIKDAHSLFITGGLKVDKSILRSTELISVETRVSTSGPQLPESLTGHCMILINGTKAMVIGGVSGFGESSHTYYLNINNIDSSSTWEDGPELLIKKHNHGCSQIGFSGPVIVAGGGFKRREIQILADWRNWKIGRYIFITVLCGSEQDLKCIYLQWYYKVLVPLFDNS